MSLLIIAGAFMILGAYLFYRGQVFLASIIYQIPNSIFLIIAFQNKDIFGGLTVFVGICLALATIYKMHTGSFVKNLKG